MKLMSNQAGLILCCLLLLSPFSVWRQIKGSGVFSLAVGGPGHYDELINRHKASLNIFSLRDEGPGADHGA